MTKPPKRPADMMQLARLIGERATGEVSEGETDPAPKPAAKRGNARRDALTPERRAEIARLGGLKKAANRSEKK